MKERKSFLARWLGKDRNKTEKADRADAFLQAKGDQRYYAFFPSVRLSKKRCQIDLQSLLFQRVLSQLDRQMSDGEVLWVSFARLWEGVIDYSAFTRVFAKPAGMSDSALADSCDACAASLSRYQKLEVADGKVAGLEHISPLLLYDDEQSRSALESAGKPVFGGGDADALLTALRKAGQSHD